MGFFINTDGFPYIENWHDAANHEFMVDPIRGKGRNAGLKPIAKRNATHMTVRRERNQTSPLGNVGLSIVFKLYNTDCVTYFEDGSKRISPNGHQEQSTIAFMTALVEGFVRKADGGFVYSKYWSAPTYYFEGALNFGADGVPLNPKTCVVHRVNRRAMKEVRKLYAPFMQYAKAMIKVAYPQDAEVSGADADIKFELAKRLDTQRGSFPNTDGSDTLCDLMRGDNIEDWADTLESVAAMSMTYRWANWSGRQWYYQPQQILQDLDEVLKYAHADAVFVEVELPIGEYKKDRNSKYVRWHLTSTK